MAFKCKSALLVSLMLVSCAPQKAPQGPSSISVSTTGLSNAEISSVLESLGFQAASVDMPATLVVSDGDPRVECESIYVRDRFAEGAARGRFTDAESAHIMAEPAADAIKFRAVGDYLDRYVNRYISHGCRLTSTFEAKTRAAFASN